MLTQSEKQKIADLLLIVLDDNEFQDRVNDINKGTVELTEKMLAELIACSRAIAGLFAALRCIPKGPSVPGWLLSCLPALWEKSKAHRDEIYSNMLCLVGIKSKYSYVMKETLLYPKH